MIHLRREGEKLHNGFNFYPLSNPGSFGFIFRYGSKLPGSDLRSQAFYFRYSKVTKKWSFLKRSPESIDKLVEKYLSKE